MFIYVKFEIATERFHYRMIRYNWHSINNNFFFIFRIFPFVYTQPKYDSAFSAAANFGFPNADHRILAFLAEKFPEFLNDFG